MPPLTLEGNTLGEKHKHFNELVKDALTDKQFNLTKINNSDGDIENLFKIDIASKTRNIDYITDVFKCDDMLYVSRAIKQSTWLITEKEYAHIINPEYLYTQLFPYMLTSAINKLLLQIRLHLKDEKRVEEFYKYLKSQDKSDEADKWLLNCSVPFIENILQDHNIPLELYKRLCRRSIRFLQYYTKTENDWRALREVLFLLKSNTEEYLNILDTAKDYCIPNLGQKHTEIIMKKYPNRVFDKFERYSRAVELSVIAKYLNKDNIKDFVLKYAKNSNTKYLFNDYENLKHFIKNIPKEDRFEFVKKIYIDKNEPAYALNDDVCMSAASDCLPACSTNSYNWYHYAPFNVAFIELKKLIRAESSPAERCTILSVLIVCAKKSLQNTKTVLQYYYDKHRNEPFKFKIQFVNNIIRYNGTYDFDLETWSILDKLFYSLEVYTESENNVQTCVKSILLYKVLHDETVPEIIEKKITFDTFKKLQTKLNNEQQKKIFSYLLTSISNKIQNTTIATESDFVNTINLLENAINLLMDWKKDIKEFPFVHEKLQELIKLKHENSWTTQLRPIYMMNKSIRRQMFEESITLCPTEEVCLNALKHNSQLLVRHSDKLEHLRTDDKVSLQRLLAKLRVYFPHTLAKQWTEEYLGNLNKGTGYKALITGLFVLLTKEKVTEFATQYVPQDATIDWSEVDQMAISLRKNIAKSLYMTRPLTSLDTVLLYAKGDYLQYAGPSLNAVIHNISKAQSRDYMSKLLEAPVSLQKYGLNMAFMKLKYEELKPIFTSIWLTTKNSTIRAHLFTHTYNLLCKAKEPTLIKELWQLLSMFIDNLSNDENKIIYSTLGNLKNVPVDIQGEFFMKSFKFLASLPVGANCETHKENLIRCSLNIMDQLDSDFVANQMLASVEEKIMKSRTQFIDVIVSYVLHGKTEEEQCERFLKVVAPALEHAFKLWETVKDDEFAVKQNVDALTRGLIFGVRKYLPLKRIIVPIKLFLEIEQIMKTKLSIDENYVRCTYWTLATEYVKLVAGHKDLFLDPELDKKKQSDYGRYWLPDEAENVWDALHAKISPEFGPNIVKHLKEDTNKYFPTICWLFSEALSEFFSALSLQKDLLKMETFKHMVLNEDFVPSYIVVCREMPNGNDDNKKQLLEILKILSSHPSLEVKMHYKKAFDKVTEVSLL